MKSSRKRRTRRNSIDFDGAWKEFLGLYLRCFLEVCFPHIAAAIDWSAPVVFLEQELQRIARGARLGGQRVDRLVKVRLWNGSELWILLHIEIQVQPDMGMPRRTYQYNHRLVDLHDLPTVTLVVLADRRKDWRPNRYEEGMWGSRVTFEYEVCKLLDLKEDDRIKNPDNPTAVLIAAHLATHATSSKPESRLRAKWRLTQNLYDRGFTQKDVRQLYRFIDWLMVLPEELEVAFQEKLVVYEKEKKMPYVTSIERSGLQKGIKKGRREGEVRLLRRQLQHRFGKLPAWVEKRLKAGSAKDLEHWSDRVLDAVILEDVFA